MNPCAVCGHSRNTHLGHNNSCYDCNGCRQYVDNRIDVVNMIGRLDRVLSEMKIMAINANLYDATDLQTLKHHAEDCVGLGNHVLELLRVKGK